jgi:predicted peroxiredoxin
MKSLRMILFIFVLLMAVWVTPTRTQDGPPTPKEIKACQKECKETYKECVQSGVEEPLCEAAYAFCNECCTGGCRPPGN